MAKRTLIARYPKRLLLHAPDDRIAENMENVQRLIGAGRGFCLIEDRSCATKRRP